MKATPARRAALPFIFVVVLMDVVALGIIIPVLPKLVEHMAGSTARGAELYGVFGTAWALMQFLASSTLGALSDRFGRRPVLLLSMTGHGLDYIVMAVAPNLLWLFIGRVISGITAASFATAFAYLADVTPPHRRAQAFGMVGAAFGVGFVLGPAVGGILGAQDPRLPFWVAAACSLANAAYGYVLVPESLPADKRMAFSWRGANPVGSLALLRRRPDLLGLAGVAFLYHLAHNVLPSVAVLSATYRFGWDTKTMGLSLAFVGVASGIVQGGLVQPSIRKLGERSTLLIGMLFGAAGFAVYGLALTGVQFWAGIPLMALWGLGGAACQGMMSRMVGACEQGQLQGANSSLVALAGLVGPGIFTQSFAYAIAPGRGWHLPGAPFLLATALLLAATGVAWYATRSPPPLARSPPA